MILLTFSSQGATPFRVFCAGRLSPVHKRQGLCEGHMIMGIAERPGMRSAPTEHPRIFVKAARISSAVGSTVSRYLFSNGHRCTTWRAEVSLSAGNVREGTAHPCRRGTAVVFPAVFALPASFVPSSYKWRSNDRIRSRNRIRRRAFGGRGSSESRRQRRLPRQGAGQSHQPLS